MHVSRARPTLHRPAPDNLHHFYRRGSPTRPLYLKKVRACPRSPLIVLFATCRSRPSPARRPAASAGGPSSKPWPSSSRRTWPRSSLRGIDRREPPRHRAAAVTGPTSRRWRRTSTPSSSIRTLMSTLIRAALAVPHENDGHGPRRPSHNRHAPHIDLARAI